MATETIVYFRRSQSDDPIPMDLLVDDIGGVIPKNNR